MVGLIAFLPVWAGVIGATFFFAKGQRAWAWLSAAAVLTLGSLWLLQSMRWVE
ncbi:MAG: hypothetical protein ABIO17_09355 [Pseudoxanthomonas sp.]